MIEMRMFEEAKDKLSIEATLVGVERKNGKYDYDTGYSSQVLNTRAVKHYLFCRGKSTIHK